MSLKKIEKKLKKPAPYVPANDDPRAELARLVNEHRALTKSAVATENMASDRKSRETGETIACRMPADIQEVYKAAAKNARAKAASLETAMRRELRKMPIWTMFLDKVRGVGPVLGAYLVSLVDFEKCTKPSQLNRFCGLAVFDGKSERPTKGRKLGYCRDLKMQLYLFMTNDRRNQRHGESKYRTAWANKKHTLLTTRGPETPENKSKGWCDDSSRRHAAGIFVEDLYIVGRALAGLPVWPSFYARATGYGHGGGKIEVLAPKMLTVEEALALVGVNKQEPESVAAE